MNKTRRIIGVGAFIMLAVLGAGWALEKASSSSRTHGGAAVVEPTKTGDAVTAPLTRTPQDESAGGAAATIDSSPEYDRSDLILSQG